MQTSTSALDVAASLQEIAVMLRLKGGRYFQARAYESAARLVAQLGDSLDTLIREDRLRSISGIGESIARQIEQLQQTGSSWLLEKLRSELPRGVVELSTVQGLSLKKIQQLQDALGISNIAELKAAAEEQKIRTVKGFGPKTEKKLLDALTHAPKKRTELHLHKALRMAEEIVAYLRTNKTVKRVEIAGDVRRWRETTTELTIVASSSRTSDLLDHFARYPMLVRVLEQNLESCMALLNTGIKVTLTAVSPNEFAFALLQATGSVQHLERLNQLTNSRSLRSAKSEQQIYRELGLQYIPPELREDSGEIEAALSGQLPEDLIQLGDIRGMVHCHTNYSDGKHTIEEMARGADELGLLYLTITDHSPTAFYAGGLKEDRLYRQWDEIDYVQDKVKVKLLRGTESDILADGSLDYPDRILDQFDVIIASIHARYRMDESQMTERITTAMRQPWFKIWGHALGRLIEHRPPFKCRMEEILDVVQESQAAIEINGDPYRLDMAPEWIRLARERGIKFVISTDAHSINGMKNLKFGVGIARRGWVRRDEVLNTLETSAFRNAVKPNSI
ncbi:MAG TPA: PHP domain-containing protein [Pyrinomonadaceae bacterium]